MITKYYVSLFPIIESLLYISWYRDKTVINVGCTVNNERLFCHLDYKETGRKPSTYNNDLHSISTLTSLIASNGAPNTNPMYKMNMVDKTIDKAIDKYSSTLEMILVV